MSMVCGQEPIDCKTKDQREAFSAVYVEWLKVRAQIEANEEASDEETSALINKESELAKTIWAMPAVVGWQVLQKIELLEAYHDHSEWFDQRDIRLVSSIRADLQVLLR